MKYPNLKKVAWTIFPVVLVYGITAATTRAEPATHTVVIETMKFSPNPLKVRVGDTIVFKNADLVPHTATEKSSNTFDSGILNRNAEWKFVPKNSGTINYKCTLHPGMEGSIVVEAAPSPSR